jgi:predicted Na+-dependent transporter
MSILTIFRDTLRYAGRSGPTLLLGGVFVGLIAPPLADAARPLMGVAVFSFTLGAFLKVDFAAFRAEVTQGWQVIAALIWSTFGVPSLMLALILLLQPDPELAQGLMLCMLAPPVGSAAAIAAMLGFSAPLALLATVIATFASPFYLPLFATMLTGVTFSVDPWQMAQVLLLIVGGACFGATLMRRYAGSFVRDNPDAMTGIAVVGLILVAIGAMRGMQVHFLANPWEALLFLGIAFMANAGFQVIGALLFSGLDQPRALAVGLVSGNRNVTLIWAAAGASIASHPAIEAYLAMSVLPIFMLPAATKQLLWFRNLFTHPIFAKASISK